MVKKGKSFIVGDYVFAKVKGYPPWPAKITSIDKKKYKVYFYGTGETANLKIEDCFHYLETKAKYANDKCLKKAHFQTAVDQIEQAIATGEDAAPLDLETSVASTTAENAPADVTVATEDETEEIVNEPSKPKETAKSTPKTTPSTPKAVAAERKSIVRKVSTEKVNPIEPITSTPVPEEPVISRSGRTIKPKRYLHEEFVEEPPQPKRKTIEPNFPPKDKRTENAVKADSAMEVEEDKNSTKEQIQFAADTVNHSLTENTQIKDLPLDESNVTELEVIPEPVKEATTRKFAVKPTDEAIQSDDLLLAITPDGRCIGIKVKCGMPDSFDTELGLQQWLKEAGEKAVDLKNQIESGACSVESVKDQLDMNPNLSPDLIIKLVAECRYVAERERRVMLESNLLEHDHLIKSCIQLTSADVDRAVELMNSYKELKVTKFMLKKHPIVVETMKRLRRYVGNTKNWGFSDEQKEEFDEKAAKVRNLAESIYNSFKSLFVVPEGRAFLDIFNEEVRLFKERVGHMTPEELLYYEDDEEDENIPDDDKVKIARKSPVLQAAT
ncbi:hypothetical protein HA402_007685 [Bradysia odoriphaga]|nr:hypothetical protein HA402_007685 [Bradysia odoriphaga]